MQFSKNTIQGTRSARAKLALKKSSLEKLKRCSGLWNNAVTLSEMAFLIPKHWLLSGSKKSTW